MAKPHRGVFIRTPSGELVPVAKQAPSSRWDCVCDGGGCSCTVKPEFRGKAASPPKPSVDWSAEIERARERRIAELKKEAASAAGRANARRHAAVEEVERLANALQDRAHGTAGAYLSPQQALERALRTVTPAVRDEYVAYRNDPDYAAGPLKEGAAGTAQRDMRKSGQRPVDLEQALAAHRDQIAKADRSPATKAAQQVRAARLSKGWSQDRLAQEAGCTRQTIIALEGDRHGISGLTMHAVCRALGLDPLELGR